MWLANAIPVKRSAREHNKGCTSGRFRKSPDSNAVIRTHKEAHGLLPVQV